MLERTYGALKERLLSGFYAPGYRLEAVRLADDLSVSMTPVRDVLNRLTGERLVHAVAGDGFYVPVITEDSLRDLIAWNAHLLSQALRAIRRTEGASQIRRDASATHADRTAALFLTLVRNLANTEFEQAVANANDRLHVIRNREPVLLTGSPEELVDLEQAYHDADTRNLTRLLRFYHTRRFRQISSLLRRSRRDGDMPPNP